MTSRALAALLCAFVALPCALASADAGPALSVDAGAGRHPISPLIYGWNFADPAFAGQIDLPVDRRGGNSADTINWKTGFENHSLDYFFEDLPWCWGSNPCDAGTDPAKSYTDQIGTDRAVGAKTMIDLPMIGTVAADGGKFDHPFVCSYDVATYPGNVDPYQTNCSDDQNAGKTAFLSNDDRSGVSGIAAPASYQGDWVTDLVGRYNTAANGGVAFYELGNEPALWNSTHHDWQPTPLDAGSLLTKSENLAKQVKQRDASAATVGPAEWGWPNYFCSAKDGGCGPGGPSPVAGTDYETYGPMMEAYLKHFRDLEQADGKRYLDYFDLHYYAQGGNTPDITRSLWDPSYRDPSWIDDFIRLIPRMREWVANDYAGTKISLSEYDLANAGDATTNNIIEADVLGIFAREQLDMATLFAEKPGENYNDAFRIYRNYDGAKSKFGDTYVSSTSADQGSLAVYGATRSGDGALTMVVVNKSGSDLTSPLSLTGFTPGSAAQVWRWATAGGGIARQADVSTCGGGFTTTYPARSVTMLVVAAGDGSGCATPAAGAGGTPGGGTPGGGTPPPTGTTAKKCVVPKLRGLTVKKAKRKLKRAHCRLGKVRKAHSRRRKGTIIRQKPKPRKRLKAGSRVAVVVARR